MRQSRTPPLLLLLLCGGVLLGGCTPRHTVRPEPAFVHAAIAAGDRVAIETSDGSRFEFTVEAVEEDALSGAGVRILFSDIAMLEKLTWKEPPHPCAGEEPVGCSLPHLVSEISDRHRVYAARFERSCAEHDYCYRHGYLTYGLEREACDEHFYASMREECSTDFLSFDLAAILWSRPECLLAARQFYEGVRRFGEEAFRRATSSYCEYDGPPESARAPGEPSVP